MPDKGGALNERVWKLFERARFETKPNTADPVEEVVNLSDEKIRTVDLSACDKALKVKIIGWNKARRALKEAFTVHVNDYLMVKTAAGADSVLFVSTEKKISEADKKYAEKFGMRVWGREELDYYEALVNAIGEYAKYEIIHSFGIKTDEEKHTYHLPALRIQQPFTGSGVDMFLFSTSPEILLKTCTVLRVAQGSKYAYQRILKKNRLGKIKDFVTKDDALLPPNIILHFGENVSWDPIPIPSQDSNGRPITWISKRDCELVVLNIPNEYASMELIDGQHRLYGFASAEPATKRSFNLVALGLKNVPVDRRRSTFVEINNNAKRVDANLVAFLKYTDDEAACQKENELMAIKIVMELNKLSPFENKIRYYDVNKGEKITLQGFAGYDLKGLISEGGLLRQHYSHSSRSYVIALRLYFEELRNLFPEQWADPRKYVIFTNRGISAFLKLLKSILKTCESPLDASTIRKYLKPLRDKWDDAHWETRRLKNAYVGTQGWKNFHRDLFRVIKRKYPKFKE